MKLEQKSRIKFAIIVMLVSLVVLSSVIFAGYNLSLYYYGKAKNENKAEAKLYNLLAAEVFWPSNDLEIAIAKIYESKFDYTKAAHYYRKSINEGGINGYLKAKYLDGQYKTAINIKDIYRGKFDQEAYYWLALSELKVGNLTKAREFLSDCRQTTEINSLRVIILENNPPSQLLDKPAIAIKSTKDPKNQYILAYNELNNRGFPQGAFSLLKEAYQNNKLSRDGLLTLAQAQIEASDYTSAYAVLKVALREDAYYPQTYRQLIKVGSFLKEDTSEYKKRLEDITW